MTKCGAACVWHDKTCEWDAGHKEEWHVAAGFGYHFQWWGSGTKGAKA